MAQASSDEPAGSLLPRVARVGEALRDTATGYRQWLGAELAGALPATLRRGPAGRHVLVVASALPPRFDGGVFRPLSWLKYAGENGWRISAVTRTSDGEATEAGRKLAAAVPEDVRIVEARAQPLKPSWKLFQQVDGGFLTALALYRTGLDAFASTPPSVVVATGPSFATFVAGRLLARRFRASLVLDYRDEWTQNPFGFVQQGRDDRWWERRCLREADLVQFTTEGQLQHNQKAFAGLLDGKGAVLLNGWEPDPALAGLEGHQRGDGRLLVAFSGVLGTMASPAAFLGDLERVLQVRPDLRAHLQLRFIGRRLPWAERELAAFGYPGLIERIEQCPRSEADRLIRESDLLLLMMNEDMARYLPGKLFEYLSTDRPILVHGSGGEGPDLVRRLGAGFHAASGDTAALEAALDAVLDAPRPRWSGAERRDWARRHTRREMARLFFERLTALVAADSHRNAGPEAR